MANKSAKAAKRHVKNPETFRERALKATESNEQPTRAAKAKNVSGKALQPASRPVRKLSSRFARAPALKPLRTVLRFVGKIIFPAYFRNSWKELRQVTWPSWRESRRLTVAVLGFAIVFGAIIALVDFGLDKLFKQVLLK